MTFHLVTTGFVCVWVGGILKLEKWWLGVVSPKVATSLVHHDRWLRFSITARHQPLAYESESVCESFKKRGVKHENKQYTNLCVSWHQRCFLFLALLKGVGLFIVCVLTKHSSRWKHGTVNVTGLTFMYTEPGPNYSIVSQKLPFTWKWPIPTLHEP